MSKYCSKSGQKRNDNGRKFELYVAQLYRDLDKNNVKHDKTISIAKKNKTKAQIDIIYTSFFIKHYVECKYHDNSNSKVGLEEVSKFNAVLELMDIVSWRGEMITNTDYTLRAKNYAQDKGIKLYNLDDLVKMEKERTSLLKRVLGYKLDKDTINKKIANTKLY